MRSGTVQHSKDHPMFGTSFGLEKTDYLSKLRMSETYSSPKRPSKDANPFYKKTMRNSSELAKPRRLPMACFGLVRNQQTESYITQVVDSHLELERRGAQATRETKRKLNPFVEECEASATQETAPKGVMPSERKRELTLAKPLSLALIMSPPNLVRKHNFNKTHIHPAIMSSNSESYESHASMCNHPSSEVNIQNSTKPDAGTVAPGGSGEDLFLRADTLLY